MDFILETRTQFYDFNKKNGNTVVKFSSRVPWDTFVSHYIVEHGVLIEIKKIAIYILIPMGYK